MAFMNRFHCKFKYLGVIFMSVRRRNKEIDTRIGEANAVLRELYRSVVTKRELSNTAKLSGFNSVFVPILTNGHESSVLTERILSQKQAAEMRFLRRAHNATLRDKVRSCEIRKALNIEQLFRLDQGCQTHFSSGDIWMKSQFHASVNSWHKNLKITRTLKLAVQIR